MNDKHDCTRELESDNQFSGFQGYKIIQIQSEDIEGLVNITCHGTEDEITILDSNSGLDDVPCDEIAAETVVMTSSPQFQEEICCEEDLAAASFIQQNLVLVDEDIESDSTAAGLPTYPVYVTADGRSDDTDDTLPTTATFVAVMPGEASSENYSDTGIDQPPSLKEIRKRERDKVKKRELRQNNKIFRQREREKARSRMKSKREDPEYREREKQRDRERRRIARQTNEEARERERIRDREKKKAQRESYKETKQQGYQRPIKTVTIAESISVENCFPSSMETEVQDYWHSRHLIQNVNIHDGPIIQSDPRTDDDEDECDSLLPLDFDRLKSDPDTG